MRRKWKEPLFALAFLVVAALLLNLASTLLRPRHDNFGATWRAYLCEPEDTVDVLFLGSSYAYCDWNPGVMYAETGLTGYVMGASAQPPGLTYWYLREALKTQSPSVVVMEGSSLFFERYEDHTKTNVGYMPWGLNRLGAIFTAAEPDKRLGLCFDLYFYHDRWKELTWEGAQEALEPPQADHLKGYTSITTVHTPPEKPYLSGMSISEEVYGQNLKELGKIARVCRQAGADLVLTINPTYSQYTPEVYGRLEADIEALGEGIRFVNWADSFEEIGLDPRAHLGDGGHLNLWGGEIFSTWTGRFLTDLGYTPREQTAENRAAWEETAEYWEEKLAE